MYSAIISGNKDVIQQKLQIYEENPTLKTPYIHELIYSILVCIKTEFPKQLLAIAIPRYNPQQDTWPALEQTIYTFCDVLLLESQQKTDSFVSEILKYLNEHYTEYDLCVTSLEEIFKCSATKLRRSFKNSMGITINDYIEQKRMDLANELLSQSNNLSEIAIQCGYSNRNSFYKAYRRIYGHSPIIQK